MGLDSVELVMEAEEEFQIAFASREVEDIRTVGEFCGCGVIEATAEQDGAVSDAACVLCSEEEGDGDAGSEEGGGEAGHEARGTGAKGRASAGVEEAYQGGVRNARRFGRRWRGRRGRNGCG